jgi:cytochrome c553
MRTHSPLLLASLVSVAVLISTLANASDAPRIKTGVELVKDKGCVSCHGEEGNGAVLAATSQIDPQYPVIAGQYADYLEYALKTYRSGERKNDVMKGIVAELSDAEIVELARYFSKQKSSLHTLKGID